MESKKLTKKEILDITDNLERILLHAYNKIEQAEPVEKAQNEDTVMDGEQTKE